jgi:hypothetical protein
MLNSKEPMAAYTTSKVGAGSKRSAWRGTVMTASRSSLSTQTAILAGESAEERDALTAELTGHFLPRGPIEERCVREMVDAEWRLRRVRALEAEAFPLLPGRLEIIRRHETHLRRQFDQALHALLDLQSRVPSRTTSDAQVTPEPELADPLEAFAMAPLPGEPGYEKATARQNLLALVDEVLDPVAVCETLQRGDHPRDPDPGPENSSLRLIPAPFSTSALAS